jgi:hypothetical protein
MQEDSSTAHIPVILCSAAEAALNQNLWRVTGPATVEAVAKPFDIDHVITAIEGVC